MMALQRADHEIARSAMTTLSRIRAQFTADHAGTSADPATAEVSQELFTRVAGLPVLLRTSGLLPTLAFYAAKGGTGSPLDRAYAEVGAALRDQITQALQLAAPDPGGVPPLDLAFVSRLTDRLQSDPDSLIHATRRLEEFTAWLSRLAEALKKEQAARKQNRTGPPPADPSGAGYHAAQAGDGGSPDA